MRARRHRAGGPTSGFGSRLCTSARGHVDCSTILLAVRGKGHQPMSPLPLASQGETRTFPARLSVLHDVEAFIDAFAARHELAPRDMMRVLLVLEELFTNTVSHGYGGDSDHPVEVTVAVSDRCVALVYRDAGQP